jgi:hypothetical protein
VVMFFYFSLFRFGRWLEGEREKLKRRQKTDGDLLIRDWHFDDSRVVSKPWDAIG